MRFDELGLAEPILRAVEAAGYTSPTRIQARAIAPIIGGADILGCAQTGTGKTGAFALPTLHRLAAKRIKLAKGRLARVLVLCPTRELATQVCESYAEYGRHLPLRHTAIFGGVSQFRQVRALQNGLDIIVATPGRLLDLMNQGYVDLSAIETLVLDEADRMLDMGFIRDIETIIKQLPYKRQTLFFSATMPGEIRRLADAILRDPQVLHADPVASAAPAIKQSLYLVQRQDKSALLVRLLQDSYMDRTLVFSRTKHGADKLVKVLTRNGIEAAAIHGNKSQGARTRALDGFKSGRTPVLVATDIASRGIDVDGITHVFNFDLPNEPETYVHRIGRTARAGASGSAIAFCSPDEVGDLRAIERLIKQTLDVIEQDFEIDRKPARTGKQGRKPGAKRRRPSAGARRDKPRRESQPSDQRSKRDARTSRPKKAGAKRGGSKKIGPKQAAGRPRRLKASDLDRAS